MSVYLLRRLLQAVAVVFAMSLIVFVGVYAIGDPVEILISPDADQMERERAIAALGLDLPLWEQYFVFLGKAVQGDLGRSFVFNEPALRLILQRMPATLELAFGAPEPADFRQPPVDRLEVGVHRLFQHPHARPFGRRLRQEGGIGPAVLDVFEDDGGIEDADRAVHEGRNLRPGVRLDEFARRAARAKAAGGECLEGLALLAQGDLDLLSVGRERVVVELQHRKPPSKVQR